MLIYVLIYRCCRIWIVTASLVVIEPKVLALLKYIIYVMLWCIILIYIYIFESRCNILNHMHVRYDTCFVGKMKNTMILSDTLNRSGFLSPNSPNQRYELHFKIRVFSKLDLNVFITLLVDTVAPNNDRKAIYVVEPCHSINYILSIKRHRSNDTRIRAIYPETLGDENILRNINALASVPVVLLKLQLIISECNAPIRTESNVTVCPY